MNRTWILSVGTAALLLAPAAPGGAQGIPPLAGTRLRLFLSAGQAPGNAPGSAGAGVPNPGVAHIHDLQLYLPGPIPGSLFSPGGRRGGAGGTGTAGATGGAAATRPAITPVRAPAPTPAPTPAPAPAPMPGSAGENGPGSP